MKNYGRFAIEILVTALLMSASGQFQIELIGIALPITLQSMFAILLPLIFRTTSASLGILLYLLLALVGLPVLAGGASGVEPFLGNSGGYLIGFVVLGAASHFWKDWMKTPRFVYVFAVFFFQHVLLTILGLSWIALLDTSTIAWSTHIGPFIPGLVVKGCIGTGLAEAYFRALKMK